DEHRVEVECRLPQLCRVVLDGDRVQVDDAEERFAALLRLDVLAEAAGVVAERLRACGLDAAEDAHGRDSVGRRDSTARIERAGCRRRLAARAPAALAAPGPGVDARRESHRATGY